MSSVPPQIIQVKRKRNDDGPVTFLRIEQSTKRHRSGAFLYQRHDPEAVLGGTGPGAGAGGAGRDLPSRQPVIHSSRPGEENLPLETVKRSHAVAAAAASPSNSPARSQPAAAAAAHAVGARDLASGTQERAPPTTKGPKVPSPVARVVIEPRRFHLSRSNSYRPAERHSVLGPGARVSKVPQPSTATLTATSRGSTPALFVERSKRRDSKVKKVAAAAATLLSTEPSRSSSPSSPLPPLVDGVGGEHTGDENMQLDAKMTTTPRKPKLPLRRQRGGSAAAASAAAAPKLPDSLVNRWDADMERLAREMNDYTLQHIARDLAKIEERDAAAVPKRSGQAPVGSSSGTSTSPSEAAPRSPSSSPNSPLKFRPHAPVKRYAERHPDSGVVATQQQQQPQQQSAVAETDDKDEDGMDLDGGGNVSDSEEDEADYVIDTYVRVAADSVRAQATPDKIGLLVLDNEPDVEFFYGEESDSEEEFEDEDDENAENYYTADYPDDEVASDDEFDRNPYTYRTGNASDLEEFDDGGDDSDESDEEVGKEGRFKITIGQPQNLPRLY